MENSKVTPSHLHPGPSSPSHLSIFCCSGVKSAGEDSTALVGGVLSYVLHTSRGRQREREEGEREGEERGRERREE